MFALINTELEALTDCGENFESNITIDYYELLDKSVELCQILRNDFIFSPVGHYHRLFSSLTNFSICFKPCTDIRDSLSDVIENMIMFGILCAANKDSGIEMSLKQKYRHYDFDEDEDGYIGYQNGFTAPKRELRIVLSDENKEALIFYRSVLSSYIESYWVAASALSKLIGVESKDEKSFFNGMIEIAKEKLQKGLLFQGVFTHPGGGPKTRNFREGVRSTKILEGI